MKVTSPPRERSIIFLFAECPSVRLSLGPFVKGLSTVDKPPFNIPTYLPSGMRPFMLAYLTTTKMWKPLVWLVYFNSTTLTSNKCRTFYIHVSTVSQWQCSIFFIWLTLPKILYHTSQHFILVCTPPDIVNKHGMFFVFERQCIYGWVLLKKLCIWQ